MRKRQFLAVCSSLICCAIAGSISFQSALAADSGTALDKDLSLLENRFFSRQYTNDPLEKRVERLELLIFAGVQEGTPEQRFARLKQVIADRIKSSSAKPAPATKEAPQSSATETPSKKPDSSSQYPVLNTLEWRALKKTYPTDSLDLRLGRLESKLFGQDSPTMPYIDRVERLKRTLGINMSAAAPPTTGVGPKPKARPRGFSQDNFGWSTPTPFPDESMLPQMPGFPRQMPGFGTQQDPMGRDLNRTFSQLFRDLNRQLQEFEKMNPGGHGWKYDPDTGIWSKEEIQIKPGSPETKPALPFSPEAKPVLPPLFKMRQPETELPPYTDPNSI